VRFNSAGTQRPAEAAPGVLRILCAGVDRSVLPYVRKPEEAWPLRLGAVLSERTGHRRGDQRRPARRHERGDARALPVPQPHLGAHIVLMEAAATTGWRSTTGHSWSTRFTHGWKSGALVPAPAVLLGATVVAVRGVVPQRLPGVPDRPRQHQAYSPGVPRAPGATARGFRRSVDLMVAAQDSALRSSSPSRRAEKTMRDGRTALDGMTLGIRGGGEASPGGQGGVARAAGRRLPASVFIDFCHLTADGEIKARFLAGGSARGVGVLRREGGGSDPGSPGVGPLTPAGEPPVARRSLTGAVRWVYKPDQRSQQGESCELRRCFFRC
jgi:hypothetical protein